jgi:hypothetical protein
MYNNQHHVIFYVSGTDGEAGVSHCRGIEWWRNHFSKTIP